MAMESGVRMHVPMSSQPGIRVHELTKTYRAGSVRALDGVSLDAEPGEILGIIGPNGAGKTTLLGCLLGFLRPNGGQVTIDGLEPDDLSVRASTGYLPERLVLDRWMTGRAFLSYHHELARLPASKRREDVEAGLATVGLDAQAARSPLRRYSRGMLQRLGFAQALLAGPRYVFLDEPMSGVDPAGVVLFRRLLADLKRRGATVVLNSHQLDLVERVCDRVAFLSRGRLETTRTVEVGAAHGRGLSVRLASGGAALQPPDVARIAQETGAELLEFNLPRIRFAVSDDAGAARLVAALVTAGAWVAEAVPEESGLERLFLEGGGSS
jgi:ABC-2 type transport system ATP-binding protein